MDEIRICALGKAFGTHVVLKDFSASFPPGSCTALMAPSGGGKTTLLRIMLGLESPDSGTVTGITPEKTGVMFQEDRLIPSMTPLENCILVKKELSGAKVRGALEKLGLSDCLGQKTVSLSGGQKRRTALARAVLSGREVLLLDEPFSGLDEEARRTAAAFLKEECAGRTMIFTTHHIDEAGLLEADILTLPPQ